MSHSIIHIGYPKAASTYLQKYFQQHGEVAHFRVRARPLRGRQAWEYAPPEPAEDQADLVKVFSNEKLAESVIVTGDPQVFACNRFIPGTWEETAPHIRIDPQEAARRVHDAYGCEKVLIVIRDQLTWIQSAYKYFQPQLPRNQRSFQDFLNTPRGKVYLAAGHYDRTISAYQQTFGPENVKVMRMEDITTGSAETVDELCGFLGVDSTPLPKRVANRGSSNWSATIRERLPAVDLLRPALKTIGYRIVARVLKDKPMFLSEEECKMIRDFYADTNRRLDKMLGNAAKADSGAIK